MADLLTIEQVAAQLHVSARTVARMIAQQTLFSVRVGGRRLVPSEAVGAMLRSTGRAS